MVGLHYLRYMFNLSDERVVWPTWRIPITSTSAERKSSNTAFFSTEAL